MKIKIDYSQVPNNFLICLNQECPQATTCLRQLVEQCIPADIVSWNTILPKYLALQQGACPYFRSSAPVRYAKGFVKLLENLPYNQMKIVTSSLKHNFGRNNYFRFRKGEYLLSPYKQKEILRILSNCGISDSLEFDAYVDSFDW